MSQGVQIVQPLYQQVYEIVKSAILEGEIKPGTKVVVTQLAEKYRISRTPLREALRQLQIEGLLVQKNSGLYVIELDANDFEELCDCRLTLERDIMRMVMTAVSKSQLEKVEQILNQADRELLEGNQLLLLELNAQFHEQLLEACPNKRAVQLLQQIRSFLLIYRANILKNNEHNREILYEHRQILEAIKEADEEKLSSIVEKHLLNDKIRGVKMIEK